jgi:hypothetical protein
MLFGLRTQFYTAGWDGVVTAVTTGSESFAKVSAMSADNPIEALNSDWQKLLLDSFFRRCIISRQRGRGVIALQVIISIMVGTVFGWYGHKAILRIQAWGVKMNEQDHILEDLTDPEEAAEFQLGYIHSDRNARSRRPVGSHHFPIGATTK